MHLFRRTPPQEYFVNTDLRIFDAVISLGGTCQVAHQLNRRNLRFASYPFDWLFSTEPDRLIEALEHDFADWLLLENLKEDDFTSTEHKCVTDTRYHMIHQHIFPLDVPLTESFAAVKQTVDRRVKRLLALRSGNRHLLFIRTNLSLEQSERLGRLIRNKFGKNAILLVVNHCKEFRITPMQSPLQNTFIYEIYDENEQTGQRWQGYDPHWDMLLDRVRVRHEFAAIGNSALFEGFYPCEVNEQGNAFRWSEKSGVLHFENYGGCKCRMTVSAPTQVHLTGTDVYGNSLFRQKFSGRKTFEFDVTHRMRYIGLEVEQSWRPCDCFATEDSRELGVCVERIEMIR